MIGQLAFFCEEVHTQRRPHTWMITDRWAGDGCQYAGKQKEERKRQGKPGHAHLDECRAGQLPHEQVPHGVLHLLLIRSHHLQGKARQKTAACLAKLGKQQGT